MPHRPTTYSEFWDEYVLMKAQSAQPLTGEFEWPGDEWGTLERWEARFSRLFLKYLPRDVQTAIEIGPGSGKYTTMFLDAFPSAKVIAADVSKSYLAVLQQRCADWISSGRLHPALIDDNPRAIQSIAQRHGIAHGQLDVLYSIDAMVHVDLQHLAAYWLSAKDLLRPGGHLIMTVADATREQGFNKLIDDVPRLFPLQGEQTDKFEWLCPELVNSVLGRLGFEIEDAIPEAKRDYYFIATKQ